MKKIIFFKIFIIFLLILAVSSCSKNGKSQNEEDDWEDEILLASECGMDGLQCCLPPEEECKYGQECCSDPYNSKSNYCADDCTLGKEHSFCRADEPRCDEGFACSDDRCMKCGGKEEPCCYGTAQCDDDFVCNKNVCEQCGFAGNICCEGTKACMDENIVNKGRTECRTNNICSFCGYDNKVSCLNEPFCNPGHLLNGTTCFQCGNLNQPCCKIDNFNVSECYQEQKLKCELGFCTKQ